MLPDLARPIWPMLSTPMLATTTLRSSTCDCPTCLPLTERPISKTSGRSSCGSESAHPCSFWTNFCSTMRQRENSSFCLRSWNVVSNGLPPSSACSMTQKDGLSVLVNQLCPFTVGGSHERIEDLS